MTKSIPLTRGKYALIDDDDYERVSRYKWQYSTHVNGGYAVHNSWKEGKMYLHRFVMGAASSQEVDHVNRDRLDCRKENLRFCTHKQNQRNIYKQNSTGYKGVTNHYKNKYRAKITVDGKYIGLGTYDTAEQAARAYDEAAKKYYGEFAYLNFD